MVAQARGEKIGRPVDPADPRIVILDDSGSSCFDVYGVAKKKGDLTAALN